MSGHNADGYVWIVRPSAPQPLVSRFERDAGPDDVVRRFRGIARILCRPELRECRVDAARIRLSDADGDPQPDDGGKPQLHAVSLPCAPRSIARPSPTVRPRARP